MQKRLILFDIDGTLIASNFAGRQVMGAALENVYGTAGALETYSFAGKTDLGIVNDLLTGAGLDRTTIQSGLPCLYDSMAEQGTLHFSEDGLIPCPGVNLLLAALLDDSRVLLGLQTGNIRPTAQQKLRAAGLNPEWFPVAAYGSDSAERAGLLPVAWRRATRLTGQAFTGHNTIVIGDTPGDIQSAKANGALAVAVASGTFSLAALAEHRPDYLLQDLSDTIGIVGLLTGARID